MSRIRKLVGSHSAWPETHESNESLSHCISIPDYPASLSLQTGCVLFKRPIISWGPTQNRIIFRQVSSTMHFAKSLFVCFRQRFGRSARLTGLRLSAQNTRSFLYPVSVYNYLTFRIYQYFKDLSTYCFMCWVETHDANIKHTQYNHQTFWPVSINKFLTEFINSLTSQ